MPKFKFLVTSGSSIGFSWHQKGACAERKVGTTNELHRQCISKLSFVLVFKDKVWFSHTKYTLFSYKPDYLLKSRYIWYIPLKTILILKSFSQCTAVTMNLRVIQSKFSKQQIDYRLKTHTAQIFGPFLPFRQQLKKKKGAQFITECSWSPWE